VVDVVPALGARLVEVIAVMFEALVPLGASVLVTEDEAKLENEYIIVRKKLNTIRHTWRAK
jgi:hypothetical protein